jgi:hypothetical protein
MAAIDLYSKPGQAGIDAKKQKALLVAWMLLTTNVSWTSPATRLVKTKEDLEKVKADGEATTGEIYYVDMRKVYGDLAPLASDEVDDLFALARAKDFFAPTSQAFWKQGESMLHYSDHYCLSMASVLRLNKTIKS